MKRFFCALLCAVLLCGLTACADWDEQEQFDTLAQYYRAESKEPDTALTDFVLPYSAGETLDPVTCADGYQLTLTRLLYQGLYELDAQWAPQPVLAAGCSYDSPSRTYTVTLRSDAVFSDGTPLTAADAAATLERARLSARYAARLSHVRAVAASGTDLRIELDRDDRQFPALLDIPIVKSGTESRLVPVGTGPYVLTEDDRGDCLVPSQYYPRQEALPFTRISLLSFKSPESAAYAFSARDIQLLFSDLTATDATALTGSGETVDAPTSTLHFIGFNLRSTLLADVRVRRALSYCLDRDALIDAYLLGHARAAQFPLSPQSALYPDDLEDAASPEDFAAAMEEAGLCSDTPRRLTLLVNRENSFKTAMAQAAAERMSAYDLQVTVSALPWEEYLYALENGSFDLYYGELTLTADWDASSLMGTGGALNYGGFSDPELDALLQAAQAAPESGRESALRNLCLRFHRELPLLPLCFTNRSLLLSAGAVEGVSPTAANAFYGLENWTVHIREVTRSAK